MTILRLSFLTPVNVLVCLQMRKAAPDLKWMKAESRQRYFYAVTAQGVMQVAIIVVAADFA